MGGHKIRLKEQEAIQRLKQGDIDGLVTLVKNYQTTAIRAAYLITRDVGMAEDVVQDSFIQAYKSIQGFDSSRPFEPWFMRSVVHAAVKAVKKAERKIQFADELDLDKAVTQLSSQFRSVEGQVETSEIQQQIWDVMEALSPRLRAVIVQRYFLEMAEKDMAVELSIAPGTVKWLLHAARDRLRTLLTKKEVTHNG